MADTVPVVEDGREIRELLRRYLERAGFAARTTHSGAEAIRLLGEDGIDLVMLDLGLPDIDGLDVLAAARAAGGVPTVVLTARNGVEERIRGLRTVPTSTSQPHRTRPAGPGRPAPPARRRHHRAGPSLLPTRPAAHRRGRHEAWLSGRLLELTPTEWGC